MGKKKAGPIDLDHLSEADKIKLEIAEEIGVYDKVIQGGWRSLSARESGKIGGILTSRRKKEERQRETDRRATDDCPPQTC